MSTHKFLLEEAKDLSKSLIWDLNKKFYQKNGITAWSEDKVPHHMTSNSFVGNKYAELIFAFIKDIAAQGHIDEKVFILELGAGHGRLTYYVLLHLDKLMAEYSRRLPSYCLILSDISESSLEFYAEHPQLQKYFEAGKLDYAYHDVAKKDHIKLRHSKKIIGKESLEQPLIVLANYFFDSIPTDYFYINGGEVTSCQLSLHTDTPNEHFYKEAPIDSLLFGYSIKELKEPYYWDSRKQEILEEYASELQNSYLFFPSMGMEVIQNLKNLSKKGAMILSMDKGFHEINDLNNRNEPDIVQHGSFSIWVNYHALRKYGEAIEGHCLFPTYSTFHLDVGCFILTDPSVQSSLLEIAYEKQINNFGPDDFTSLKQMAYSKMAYLSLQDIIGLLRLSYYDSSFFIYLLPRFKQVTQEITFHERKRIEETLHLVWKHYFHIQESFDLGYELGAQFYDLGRYEDAIQYFQFSINFKGIKADTLYNQALCYYQLRRDKDFYRILEKGKKDFPEFDSFSKLDDLDMDS